MVQARIRKFCPQLSKDQPQWIQQDVARERRFLLIGSLPFGPDMTNTFFQKIWSGPDLTDTYSLKLSLHLTRKARLPKRYPWWPGLFDDLFGKGGFLLIDGLPFDLDLANTFLKNANCLKSLCAIFAWRPLVIVDDWIRIWKYLLLKAATKPWSGSERYVPPAWKASWLSCQKSIYPELCYHCNC